MKKAIITGITGQDGAYLTRLLLEKGYEVHGIKRRTSTFNTFRIDEIYEDANLGAKLKLHFGDLSDAPNLIEIIKKVQPDEIYNLGAQSHVKVSFENPEYTSDIDALGVLRILEAVRICGLEKKTRIYQASSSEMFGEVLEIPQKETTPFNPRSPYGVAKVFGFNIIKNYRESYGMFASNGILFNHESPLRGETFVTRKITRSVARISLGLEKVLELGNLDAKRDWGHAKDYVHGMWLMMQQDKPGDYVLATGITTTVRDFTKMAFAQLGIDINFSGEGLDEKGIVAACRNPNYQLPAGKEVVKINPRYFRPAEVDLLIGDSKKARTEPKMETTGEY